MLTIRNAQPVLQLCSTVQDKQLINLPERVCQLWNKLKQYLRNLNFFPSVPPSIDQYELQTQRLSTRLFIILFAISLTILLLYTSLIKVRKTISVEDPTFEEYIHLNSTYSQALTCPCSNISINYDAFLHINYTLHQVCTSNFIDQDWIKYLENSLTGDWHRSDFRWTSIHSFQALKTLCELINRTISDRLTQFYSNQYVSASVIRQTLFELETRSLIDQFRSSLINNFLLSLAIIRDATQANALFSALQNNYYLFRVNNSIFAKTKSKQYDNCTCAFSLTCISQSSIYDYATVVSLFDVPNFYIGCNVMESLFQSTLECFYDEHCMDDLQYQIPSLSFITVKPLDESLLNKYFTNSTIQHLVDHLMIEQWNPSIIFENYYNACHPLKCVYTLAMNNDLIYIFTTLFGIAGGLITVLKLIVPRFIKRLRNKREQQPITIEEVPIRNNIRHLSSKLKHHISTFNIFPSVPPSTNQRELQTQRISTRLFIILLSISVTILLLYTSLITITKTASIKEPTFEQYVHLNLTYSQGLTCPCSKISINYGAFLHVDYTLHQVCTSTFVNQTWINHLGNTRKAEFLEENVEWAGPYAFQALRSFCHLINQTISYKSIEFSSSQYISASVVPETVFVTEIKSLMNQFRSSLTNDFLLSLATIRDTTQANALFSALQSNYFITVPQDGLLTSIRDVSYSGCNCGTSSTCIDPNSTLFFAIPYFPDGCYVIEALLQSTLECFYDQQCIDDLQRRISPSSLTNVTALDQSLPSEYFMNSTIQELLDDLMIEQWNVSPMFISYYNQCQPIECTYTFEANNDAIYIITTLFGIAGGLITVLKFITPQSVKLVRQYRERWQQQPSTEIHEQRRAISSWKKLKQYLRNLNFFPSIPPSTDENEVHTQRIASRSFIILFSVLLAILLLYNSIETVTKTVHVNKPTFNDYLQLYSTYSEAVTCPCSRISINYGKVVRVDYTLHQVCSSDFVNQNWIVHVKGTPGVGRIPIEFRVTGPSSFQALRTFCHLIDRTMNDSLTRFYSNRYIGASVISQKSFEAQINSSIKKFRSSLISSFSLSLAMIQNITQANALFSARRTNYISDLTKSRKNFFIHGREYNGCNCGSSSICTDVSSIYDPRGKTRLFNVTGLLTGCFVVESLLQSTLQCFYDQQCIDELERHLSSPLSINVTVLDASSSNYSANSTIKKLVDNLMIEVWNASPLFENYYNECLPKECSYTFETNHDIIYIFTTLFGVAGGLTTVLQLVAPRLVKIIVRQIRMRRIRIAPEAFVIDVSN